MKKSIFAALAAILVSVSAFAQPLVVQDKDFEKFTKISVEDNFVIKFIKSARYSVTLKTDERIAAHVQAYVKNGTLYLILDEKGYSPELKKQLRQKGAAAPVLEAEVYMPTVNSIVLKEKAVVTTCDNFETETFTMTVTDHALVSHFDVTCSTGELNVSKNAQVTGTVSVTSKMYLNASNSAQVSLTQNGGNAFVSQANSAYIDFKATLNTVEVESSGGSESHVSGIASLLKVTGSGLSRVDAELLESKDGDVVLSGSSKCHVNVTDHLKVNLAGGSMLTFKRNPVFEIDRVVNSTLIKADDVKRK
jgi:hypothetical protein